jgi:7-carboxy-7-deazaguanine synthase
MRFVEIFDSVQGEGSEAGLWTRFVRLAGCNLSCDWCDTPESRDLEAGMDITPSALAQRLTEAPRVCITGGEPLLQQKELLALSEALGSRRVTVETNGSLPLDRLCNSTDWRFAMDAKPPSSGHAGSTLPDNYRLLSPRDDVKVVAMTTEDLVFAHEVHRSVIAEYQWGMPPTLYICATPDLPMTALTEFLSEHPQVRAYVQLHKVLKLP